MFCTNCGAPVTGAFCGGCGRPAGQAPASQSPPAPGPSAAPPPAAAKGSALGKFLLIGFGCSALLAVLASAGMYYAINRLRTKALQRVSEYTGVTVGNAVKTTATCKNPCGLLPKEEVEQVLGIQIEKTAEVTETGEPGCAFFTAPEAFQQLAKDSLATVPAQVQAGAAKETKSGRASDNPRAAQVDVEQGLQRESLLPLGEYSESSIAASIHRPGVFFAPFASWREILARLAIQ